MTDEQRQEIMRRYNEGMCAMSDAQMAIRAAEQAEGMRQRGPLTSGEQESMRNFWGAHADEQNNIIQDAPPVPTLFERFKRWILA
jgi:hypothetical protein